MPAQNCYFLTTDELATMIAAGYSLVSGPYDTSEECLAACNGGAIDYWDEYYDADYFKSGYFGGV